MARGGAPYLNHWFALGWNAIEADGHNPHEPAYAYRLATEGFGPGRPTVVMAHTRKGADYGRLEGTGDSHGTPPPHANMSMPCASWDSRFPA